MGYWESDLRGGALKLQQHQRTGTFQDVKVKQEWLLPVVARALKRTYHICRVWESNDTALITSGNSLQGCSGLAAELPPAVCGVDHLPGVALGPGCAYDFKHTKMLDLSETHNWYTLTLHITAWFYTYCSKSRVILPMIPTAKYPNKARMKMIQQRISVQPLRQEKYHYTSCQKGKEPIKGKWPWHLTCCEWAPWSLDQTSWPPLNEKE